MNELFGGKLPDPCEMRKAGVRLLSVIVNRNDSGKVTRLLHDMHFHFLISVLADGTSGGLISDLLGLGSVEKTVVLCVAPGVRTMQALEALTDVMKLNRPGKGIAFTMPVSDLSMISKVTTEGAKARCLINFEEGVENMSQDSEYSLILAILNEGFSEEVVEAAKEAGATGGTIMSARNPGAEEIKLLGIPVQTEKEIVAIVVAKSLKQDIFKKLNDFFSENSKAHGILLSLPIETVAGLDTARKD